MKSKKKTKEKQVPFFGVVDMKGNKYFPTNGGVMGFINEPGYNSKGELIEVSIVSSVKP